VSDDKTLCENSNRKWILRAKNILKINQHYERISESTFQILQLICHTKHSGWHPLFDNVSEIQTEFYNFPYKITVVFLLEWTNGIAGFGPQKAV